MKTYFYDIESLQNVFSLAIYKHEDNEADIYYLIDNEQDILNGIQPDVFLKDITDKIYEKNSNFRGKVNIFDLKQPENVVALAKLFGLSDAYYAVTKSNKSSYPAEYRAVCDTDEDYDEDKHPYLFGYNSDHYDTTMLTLFLYDSILIDGRIKPVSAKTMRIYNDQLFLGKFRDRMEDRLKCEEKDKLNLSRGFTAPDYRARPAIIRKNMLMTGRNIDVARLNEKMNKVALKRILGMLGYQILESDKLQTGQDKIDTYEQFLELIAYNMSDVVNLRKLFEHKTYQSAFILKKQLLKTYPELIYKEIEGKYKPDISPDKVRNDRLIISSSSAQFSTKSLCPYGHLTDYDTVSFDYPSEAKAKALGIKRVNVLDEAKDFFYRNFPQPELRAKFDEIYNYYKSIEGKNFNPSKNYLEDHDIDTSIDFEQATLQLPLEYQPQKLNQIPNPNTCMFYYKKDGTPSTCFVNFSTGGIHGAEYNKALYDADVEVYNQKMAAWQEKAQLFARVKQLYPDPRDIKKEKNLEIDGVKYKPSDFLKPKATEQHAEFKDLPKQPVKPEPFEKNKKGLWGLKKRYAYTSADLSQHEDFTSYYPNLLRMMDAFYNKGLGYDRYGEIFDNKTKYGHMMKDEEKYSEDERELYSVMRNGTKLILNSASGAADANFESNIVMNNKIISMRIIGQLFTWRIGQAQTLAGASITSTNTDGLYSARIDADLNNQILAKESADINVEIEPEPIYLISKDSNNRAEIAIKNNQLDKIVGANGGSLAARKGPNPEKNLAHAAILDWALAEYLAIASVGYKGLALTKEMDREIGMAILKSARSQFNDDIHTLTMFQNVIASSPGKMRFVFATQPNILTDMVNDTDLNDDDTDDDTTIMDDSGDDDEGGKDKVIHINAEPINIQHYNRCFIVKDGTPNTYHLQVAAAKVVTEPMIKKRTTLGEMLQQHDPIATKILEANGVNMSTLPFNKEATVVKIAGIENNWYINIDNRNMHDLDKTEIDIILESLDYEKYLSLLTSTYMKNWFIKTPEWEAEQAEKKKLIAAEKKRRKAEEKKIAQMTAIQ